MTPYQRLRVRLTAAVAALVFAATALPALAVSNPVEWIRGFVDDQESRVLSIAVDDHGNVAAGGRFEGSIEFDPTAPGTHSHDAEGENDGFVVLFDRDGVIQWVTTFTLGEDTALRVESVAFGPGGAVYAGLSGWDDNTFENLGRVVALDATDGSVSWSAVATPSVSLSGVAVAPDGSVVAVGSFWGASDFGDTAVPAPENEDAFVWMLTPAGGTDSVVVAEGASNSDWSFARKVAVHSDGGVYATGSMNGEVDFDAAGTGHAVTRTSESPFVWKVNPTGGFDWVTVGEGDDIVSSHGIALDANGRAYVAGEFFGSVDFDTDGDGAVLTSDDTDPFDEWEDGFVWSVGADGSFRWVMHLTGAGRVEARDAVVSGGRLVVAGIFQDDDVTIDPGGADATLEEFGNGRRAGLLLDLTLDGTLVDTRRVGGSATESSVRPFSVAIDPWGSILFGGRHRDVVDYDPDGVGALFTAPDHDDNGFVVKLAPTVSGDRLWGQNRYETAVEVSKYHHPGGSDLVFIARGDLFPDALTGGVAAALGGAPVLLVRPNEVPQVVTDEILRLGATEIVILGGPVAVSNAVEQFLGSATFGSPDVSRLWGPNRYGTSVEISEYLFPAGADVVVVASGENFPDALSGIPLAAQKGGSLLLTRPGSLPSEVAAEIARLDPSTIYLLGGPVAVDPSVFTALEGMADDVIRLSGPNRYGTSVAISMQAFPAGTGLVYLATGEVFADALTGGAAAGLVNSPMLLTRQADLPQVVADEIARLGATQGIILGGPAAVSAAVEAAFAGILGA